MTKKTLSFFFGIVAFFLSISPTTLYAQQYQPIDISGFSLSRSGSALLNDLGNPLVHPAGPNTSSTRIGNFLLNEGNFGESGIVKCAVDFQIPKDYISTGSLVNNGDLLVDVFFATNTPISLTQEEITELKNFLNAGGILYAHTTSSGGDQFVPLFQELGINVNFGDKQQDSTPTSSSDPEDIFPTTNGPFGVVGPLLHGPFRSVESADVNVIAYSINFEKNILVDTPISKGYLSVAGSPLHVNIIALANNLNYFGNLISLGCKDNSVVLEVPSFKQGLAPYDNVDPNWETQIYDHGNELDLWCDTNHDYASIAECGCALTSAAMVANYHGVKKAFGGFLEVDPFSLNLYANETFNNDNGAKGFLNGNFVWDYLDNFSAQAADVNNNQKVEFASRENFNSDRIKQLIDEGKPVIVNVIGDWGEHWVVVKGYNPDTNRLIINDPAKKDPIIGKYMYLDEFYTPKPNNSMIVYQKTNSDFRRLQFASTSQNHLLVTDSFGNKTGYDPDTSQFINEIPNSSYALDNYYGDATSPVSLAPATEGVYFLTLDLPQDSEYKLQIMSQDDQYHPVQVYTSDVEGGLAGKIINPEEIIENYTLAYVEETAGQEVNATEDIKTIFVNIDVEPFVKNNVIIPHRLFTVPVAVLASDEFDVLKIDNSSLKFGKTGQEESLISCGKILLDVNRDKKRDLICYFYGNKLDLDISDEEVVLKGLYDTELPFEGKDNINVFKPWFLF